MQLTELVLDALRKHEYKSKWCHHIAFLTSEFYLKRKNQKPNGDSKKEALRYLYSKIHEFPDKPLLRKVLANFLLHNEKGNDKHQKTANRMVEATITIQRNQPNR